MKKVLIFALIVAFLSVVAFADDTSNNTGTVNLSLGIERAVELTVSNQSATGWSWDPDSVAAIPTDVITADVTIFTNTKFTLSGEFKNDGTTYFGDIIVQNSDGSKGIKVLAQIQHAAFGTSPINAVDSATYDYMELWNAVGTGSAQGTLMFSLYSFAPVGETFNWYDVEAGTDTPVQYIATISPATL